MVRGFTTNEWLLPITLFALALSISLPILAVLRAHQSPSTLHVTIAAVAWLVCAGTWLKHLLKMRSAERHSRELIAEHEDSDNSEQK